MRTTEDEAATSAEVASTEQLVVGLDRLLRVSSIYAQEHPVVARMATPVMASLQSLCALDGSVLVAIDAQGGLEVADATFPASHPAAARLRELLEHGGVEGVEIAAAATAEHLCELGRVLRARPADTALEHDGEIPGLPPTLRVVVSHFGVSCSPRTRDTIERLLEEILHAAFATRSARSAGEPEVALRRPARQALIVAKKALLLVLARIEEESAGEVRPDQRGAIVRLLSSMTRSALAARGEVSRSTLTINRLLVEMREVLLRTSGEETASDMVERAITAAERLLLPLTVGHAPSPPIEPSPQLPADPDAESMAAVVRQIEESLRAVDALEAEGFDCSEEHLAIVVQMRCDGTQVVKEAATDRELLRALAATRDEQRAAVLAGFVGTCAKQADPARADRLLSMIARTLRQDDPARFAGLLAAMLDALPPEARTWLWPHVASELLLGLPPHAGAVEETLLAVLVAMPRGSFDGGAPRLLRTPCARGGIFPGVVRRLLSPPRVELFPLYDLAVTLPETSGIGELVLEAFRQRPPPLAAAKALAAVQQLDGRARTLLRQLLQMRGGDEAQRRELDRTAVNLLIDALLRQPSDQRDEPWVLAAVRALAGLPGAEGAAMLRRIAGERRWLVVPTWPAACRRAARGLR